MVLAGAIALREMGLANEIIHLAFDLDKYVVEQALRGLFHVLGEQEKNIRTNNSSESDRLAEKGVWKEPAERSQISIVNRRWHARRLQRKAPSDAGFTSLRPAGCPQPPPEACTSATGLHLQSPLFSMM